MKAALRGEAVDRVPIWGREGFRLVEPEPEPDDFRCGWQCAPAYRELAATVCPHLDGFVHWGIPAFNRALLVPPSAFRYETVVDDGRVRVTRIVARTPRGELVAENEQRRGQNTVWHRKPLVTNREELARLAEVPWELAPETVATARADYRRAAAAAGTRALPLLGISSPIVCISGCTDFGLFLELSLTDRPWIEELAAEITRRTLAVLAAVWEEDMETAVNIGGSEQCTPPMMAPAAYDDYVLPYDDPIVAFCRRRGAPVKIHCHGKVHHALRGMLAMGADATDPVEPPPDGDVTWEEAKAIAGDRLTLIGNLEFDDLCKRSPDWVRAQVRAILATGERRTVVGTSAGPIEAVGPRFVENWQAVVDEVCGVSA